MSARPFICTHRITFLPIRRFNCMATSSFKELPQGSRDALQWLHDDYMYK